MFFVQLRQLILMKGNVPDDRSLKILHFFTEIIRPNFDRFPSFVSDKEQGRKSGF